MYLRCKTKRVIFYNHHLSSLHATFKICASTTHLPPNPFEIKSEKMCFFYKKYEPTFQEKENYLRTIALYSTTSKLISYSLIRRKNLWLIQNPNCINIVFVTNLFLKIYSIIWFEFLLSTKKKMKEIHISCL